MSEVQTGTVFGLGYQVNPYNVKDREYFWWTGDDRKRAKKRGDLLQNKRQPNGFRDWMAGHNRYFTSKEAFAKAANKVGLNPNLEQY